MTKRSHTHEMARARELLESDRLGLLERLDVGVLVQGPGAKILFANETASALLGLSADRVHEGTAFDSSWEAVRSTGEHFPAEERPVARAFRTGEPQHDVVLGVLRDGERHWLLTNAVPHRDDDGEVAYVVLTVRDISREQRRLSLLERSKLALEESVQQRTAELAAKVDELRETTAALQRSQAIFKRVTESVPGTLYQLHVGHDGTTELRFVSAGVQELCGIGPQEALAHPERVLALIRAEDRQRLRREIAQAQLAERGLDLEFRVRAPEGKWRWVRSRAEPEVGPDGVMWSGMMLDFTEQRMLADQIRVSQTRDAIGAVTAGIAHNFNNALAVLVPNLEECLATAPEFMKGSLQESLQVAFSSTALVKQLMAIVQEGSTEAKEPVDLVAMVRDVTALCRRIFRGRVIVAESIEIESARIMGQTAAVRQLLLNLCINARDALQGIDSGRIEVSVRESGDRVLVSVHDNGCGMDDLALRRLGEPFFTTKAPGEGTGLGLATAYATVRDLGGSIACESAPGVGTVFDIALPLLDRGTATPREQPSTDASRGPASRGRLLIIDDERLVRSAIRKVLTRRGFEVDEAPDGLAGLARVEQASEPYQGVLLDLSMPGISGERVLERLHQSHPRLPVVILSGFVEDPTRLSAAAAVLNKPLTSKALVEALDRVLA
ncbi:MAG: response regulator [Myxococcales bacterium]|nr:response regulator [Myxococcales bacterium]